MTLFPLHSVTLLEEEARDFAIRKHAERGQFYGNKPYETHLQAVVDTLLENDRPSATILAAAWLHDTIEDCGVTMDQIATLTSSKVAVIVWAVSGTVGTNRKERQANMLRKLREIGTWMPEAIDLKLADRIANVQASHALYLNGDYGKFRMYQKEHTAFSQALYGMGSSSMWRQLTTWITTTTPV